MASEPAASSVEQQLSDPKDVGDLHQFGYTQSLRSTMGPFASFSVAFSMVSITTAIFFLLPSLFGTSGAAGVWLWLPCAAGVFLVVLVYSHLAARIPITGFAYQWNSRLINPHYGWFTGYTAMLAFMAGTAATAVALATVFAGDIWKSPDPRRHRAARHGRDGRRRGDQHRQHPAVSAVNNVGVFFEIVGSVVAALLLLVGSSSSSTTTRASHPRLHPADLTTAPYGTDSSSPRCCPCTASSAGKAPPTWPRRPTTRGPSRRTR